MAQLADCEIHACRFKLGAPALEQLAAIDWDKPDGRRDVDALIQRRMVVVETVRKHLAGYPKSRLPGARDRLH
jgi:hypothetical protein